MDPTLKLSVLLILLALVSELVNASPTKVDYGQCERIVKKWASSALDQEVEDKHKLQDLLFFLHVPRTGGRTYFHCFLRKLYPNSLECPRSYDRLRFDPSKLPCRLLATHDDYSIISKFPREKTSVVTILRNPLDRIFSTYEFSIEVAARFLLHPNLTSATQMDVRLRSKSKGVSTLDIWPWKYLVPWMREDLFARRDARAHREPNYIERDDPYSMKDTVMPLHEYINDPIAMDVVHNGATFQVAGLTNNSFLAESHEVRHCIEKCKTLGKYVLEVAKKRLDDMLYVGLTEDHRESAAMFADIVGSQVLSQRVVPTGDESARENRSENSSLDPEPDISIDHQSAPTDQKVDEMVPTEMNEAVKENMTVEKLMGTYETCISNLRKSQTGRRIKSLKRISPANFTKEARRQVSEVTIQEILSLNSLDVELYKHAQNIFARQQQRTVQKFTGGESLGSMSHWTFPELAIPGVLTISLVAVFVNARRRRASKVKI